MGVFSNEVSPEITKNRDPWFGRTTQKMMNTDPKTKQSKKVNEN